MGRFSKYWTFWARTVWLFTGRAPENAANSSALQSEMDALRVQEVDAQLELIREQHRINGIRAQYDFIRDWQARP